LKVTVAGIIKDWNQNTDFPFTEFISSSTINVSFLKNTFRTDAWEEIRGNPWIWSAVKLSKGVTEEQIIKQFHSFLERHMVSGDPNKDLKLLLQPLSDVHFNLDYPHDNIRKAHLPTLYGLVCIAIFI